MSHEIRTPMTAILGYTDLIAERLHDQETLEWIKTIRQNGDFLLEIINDILDISKIEAGKIDVARDVFAPTRLIEDVRSIMNVRAIERGIALEVEYATPLPAAVTSDMKRWKQILINLVGNAIKFTRHGRVKIIASYGETLLKIDIVDTGIGMSEQQLASLFQPFSQGNESVSGEFGGTGLGLAISQRLAQMLGGEITVASQLNVGSRFTVAIQAEQSTAECVLPPQLTSGQTINTSQSMLLANAKILLVDDRRDIRYLSKSFLASAGANIREAVDGEIAIQIVSESEFPRTSFDLVLLDMQMPKLDGYQTATKLRELGFEGPIIALTADAMDGDMSRCIAAGCNDYLSKPIDKIAMLEMIYKHMSK